MTRVSTNMEQANFLYYNGINESVKNKVDGQLQSQRSIKLLRDDPAGSAASIRFQSKTVRLEKYAGNIDHAISAFSVVEGHMSEAGELLQRVRELAVQGANGVLDKSQMGYIAEEVNQYLEEMVSVANQKGADGMSLFSGTRTDAPAFRVQRGVVDGASGQVITGVQYTGNPESRTAEYSDGEQIKTQFAGNRVFWSEDQRIFGGARVDGFVTPRDTYIVIDGERIDLTAGDGIGSVVDKINASNAPVKASLDPVENTLIIKSTVPHQIWLDDAPDGTTLSSLGLIDERGKAPNNSAASARTFGGSAFDSLIQLRDALYSGDHKRVGGVALGGIDGALVALSTQRTELGARQNRLKMTLNRVEYETVAYKGWDDQLRGLDFAEAITEKTMIDTALQASYRTASDIMKPTLMDFLR